MLFALASQTNRERYIETCIELTKERGDTMAYLVELKNIVKTFPGVMALNNVNFTLNKGEVHVLLGENGAGKSTLIKILSGVYPQDSGDIIIEEEKHEFKLPIDASKAGIATIYQEFNLVEHLSVAENVYMGRLPKKSKFAELIDFKKLYKDTEDILKDINMDIDSKTKVKTLGVAQKQMVEIAKAISIGSKVLIMDEPTAVLTSKEIDELFRIIDLLRAKGVGIIYISHRLQELARIGDRVTVLRDGEYITDIPLKGVEVDTLIKLMVGRELKEKFPPRKSEIGENVLEVKNLSTKDKLKSVSFNLKKGEVLGIAGLVGSGRTEMARAIFGADTITSGEILINDKKVKINKPLDAIKNRIAYLTEERKKDGLVLILSVKENITMASSKEFSKGPFVDLKKEKIESQSFVDKLAIKTPDLVRKTLNLSGGNQQKVIIAKWLCANADIFIFDEPTRGIDVGAKVDVYHLMNEIVSKGSSIIMISSELPEVLGMSDRILVMSEGSMVAEFSKEDATQEKILNAAINSNFDSERRVIESV